MSALITRRRSGFTIVEILVALVVLSIIGAGIVRLLLSQTRFTEKQMSARNARSVSRNAMNIILTDLRMVQDNGGLVGASTDSVTVRVPLAFGLYCGSNTLSLLPVDSAMTALGYYGGWAVRDSTSQLYSYADANNIVPFGSMTGGLATTCTNTVVGAGISTVTVNGRTGVTALVADGPSGPATPGWPVFIYQRVTYRFQNSAAFPGRIGLFRKVKTGSGNTPTDYQIDEIIAPFDTSAKFRYYVLNADTAQWAAPAATPAAMNSVRGIQLYLAGSSPRVPQSSSSATTAALVTGVFFKNRSDLP
jgi:prepilin-type N-terminal cleavage/methylation domain-containing protein